MIDINVIAQRLTTKLNENTKSGLAFVIMADGGNFIPDTRKPNTNEILRYINGEANIIDGTITPVNGVVVLTQTVGVSVLVRIDQTLGFDESVKEVRNAISAYTSKPDVFGYEVPGQGTFTVSMYGTQPEVGTREVRPQYGDSVDYSFTCYFTIIQNGVNSSDQKIYFENEPIPFTTMTISRVPIEDGSAFSDSNGSAKSWISSTALQISLVVPALSNNALTQAYSDYLLNGTYAVYDVDVQLTTLTTDGVTNSNQKRMRFGVGNMSMETINNVGMTINLIEALEVENG